jgi:hypothetical protein
MVMYHGTNKDFTQFIDRNRKGFWFSQNPGVGDRYANRPGGNLKAVYLDIKNPISSEDYYALIRSGAMQEIDNVPQELIRMGYDGIMSGEPGQFGIVAVLSSSQIKSATGHKSKKYNTTDINNSQQ